MGEGADGRALTQVAGHSRPNSVQGRSQGSLLGTAETGPRGMALKQASEVPEQSLIEEAAGGWREASCKKPPKQRHKRERPDEFLD